MAITYFYFDNAPVYQADWQKTIGAVLYDGVICGFFDDLFTYADGSGMQVKVKAGAAHIKGNYFFSDEETILTIAAAPSTAGQTRHDLVVCEVDWLAKTMSLKVLTGTAGASPAAPALTRTSTVWQIPIARVTVGTNVTNIAATAIYDQRAWALGTFELPFIIGNGTTVVSSGTTPVPIIIPAPSRIVSVHIVSDLSGSITLDLWKANFPTIPVLAGSIIASGNKPALSSAQVYSRRVWTEANYLTLQSLNWPGSVFEAPVDPQTRTWMLANVESPATLRQVNLTLRFAKMISPVS
jgi:hypothetical protein